MIISLPHPVRNQSSHMIPIPELCRLVNDGGYGLIGFPAVVWRKDKIIDQLNELEEKGLIQFLSLQHTELDEFKCFYYVAVIKGGAGE